MRKRVKLTCNPMDYIRYQLKKQLGDQISPTLETLISSGTSWMLWDQLYRNLQFEVKSHIYEQFKEKL